MGYGQGDANMRETIDVMTAWATGGDEYFAVHYYNKLIEEFGTEKRGT